MRKEKPAATEAEPEREVFPKKAACDRRERGGAEMPGNGTTCVGGTLFFWSKYQGEWRRFARRCPCGGTYSELPNKGDL